MPQNFTFFLSLADAVVWASQP